MWTHYHTLCETINNDKEKTEEPDRALQATGRWSCSLYPPFRYDMLTDDTCTVIVKRELEMSKKIFLSMKCSIKI